MLPAYKKKPYLASSCLLSCRQQSDKMATKKELTEGRTGLPDFLDTIYQNGEIYTM
jgi:hypothetical protein